MTSHRAVVLVDGYGPRTTVICPTCGLLGSYPRTAPARDAARAHNDLHPEEP